LKSALFWWSTINKNVNWINYIYYNQQRFVNCTRDAVRGTAKQLHCTSKIAWENQMAVNMTLSEKGRICVLTGGECCTFIPSNTAPDGTITKALQGLTALSNELAKNSGINDPLTSWLEQWFGKWEGVMTSILASLLVIFGAIVLTGCCVISCIWGLILTVIETTLTKQIPISYQLLLSTDEIESQIMLNEFKEKNRK
jgi:hypothetical protein